MDGEFPGLIKTEAAPEMDDHQGEELIVPDLVSSGDHTSSIEKSSIGNAVAKKIKVEPVDGSRFVDEGSDLENPYQCFECGMDCESQRELIDHYESAHTEETLRQSDNNGNSFPEPDSDDPLAGDEAPDSPEKPDDAEGAQNGASPYDVLLLYSCPCCGHSSSDWNHLAKHLEMHVQVTCLSCLNCMHIFSNNYHLKGFTGKDPSDQPHVCYHCPFRTREHQELKNHCISHHKIVAPREHAANNDQNAIPPTALVKASLETTDSKHSIVPLATPHILGMADVVLGDGSQQGQNFGNSVVPVQNYFLGTCPYPTSGSPKANRALSTKVPVDVLLEKWSLPKIAGIIPDTPADTPCTTVNVMPPCRAPRGTAKHRRANAKPCPYCSHMARDSHSLKTHILTHTKEKPFACEFCNYRATQRAHLNKHMQTHIRGRRGGADRGFPNDLR